MGLGREAAEKGRRICENSQAWHRAKLLCCFFLFFEGKKEKEKERVWGEEESQSQSWKINREACKAETIEGGRFLKITNDSVRDI